MSAVQPATALARPAGKASARSFAWHRLALWSVLLLFALFFRSNEARQEPAGVS